MKGEIMETKVVKNGKIRQCKTAKDLKEIQVKLISAQESQMWRKYGNISFQKWNDNTKPHQIDNPDRPLFRI